MQDQNHFFESEDHTMEFDTQDAQDAKIWSVLAYFGILFFLPLVAGPILPTENFMRIRV